MKHDVQIVTEIPLKEIWNKEIIVSRDRKRYIKENDIKELLRKARAQFIVANIGDNLKWIPEDDCFSFWKNEVKIHLVDPNKNHVLEDFPGEYFYLASEWKAKSSNSVILLEMYH